MSTAQKHITACDGPGCKVTHDEGEMTIPVAWCHVSGKVAGNGGRDFCSIGCLATWAMAKASDLTQRGEGD